MNRNLKRKLIKSKFYPKPNEDQAKKSEDVIFRIVCLSSFHFFTFYSLHSSIEECAVCVLPFPFASHLCSVFE